MQKREFERYIDRMSILVDLLKNSKQTLKELHVNRFNMNFFGRKGEYGTAACAAGLAALSPKLRGLTMQWNEDLYDDVVQFGFVVQTKNKGLYLSPYEELADYFGLKNFSHCAEYLFDPWNYKKSNTKITSKDVLRRVLEIFNLMKKQYKIAYGVEYHGKA